MAHQDSLFWQQLAVQNTVGSAELEESSGRIGHPDHCHRTRYVPNPGKREGDEIRRTKSGQTSETTEEPLRRGDLYHTWLEDIDWHLAWLVHLPSSRVG